MSNPVVRHRLIGAACVAVAALLSVDMISAQAAATGLIGRDVPPPSSDFKAYVEGALVQVSVPSNWRELPASNGVTFAPDGAYGNAGAKSVFTHGLGIGLIRNDKHSLQTTTEDFIVSQILDGAGAHQRLRYRKVRIADRPGLHTVVSTVSAASDEPEQIQVFTTLLRDGTLLYVLAVSPRDSVAAYAGVFRRVVGSIQIMDCDRCVQQ